MRVKKIKVGDVVRHRSTQDSIFRVVSVNGKTEPNPCETRNDPVLGDGVIQNIRAWPKSDGKYLMRSCTVAPHPEESYWPSLMRVHYIYLYIVPDGEAEWLIKSMAAFP